MVILHGSAHPRLNLKKYFLTFVQKVRNKTIPRAFLSTFKKLNMGIQIVSQIKYNFI